MEHAALAQQAAQEGVNSSGCERCEKPGTEHTATEVSDVLRQPACR